AIALPLVAVDHVSVDQVGEHVLELVPETLAEARGYLGCRGPAVRRSAGQVIDDALLERGVVAAGQNGRPGLLFGPGGARIEMHLEMVAENPYLIRLVDTT